MISHLADNVTFIIPIWVMTATDGTVAAYASHTRPITFNSINYTPAPVEPTRFSEVIGLDPNHVEVFNVFDDIVTEADVQGGRWKNARAVYDKIAYNPATGAASATVTGSAKRIKGKVGKITINNGTYRMEINSLSAQLGQEIGELTSPMARNRQLSDLVSNVAPYTFARTITAFTDRRNFTVNGTAQINDYFKYGKVTFTSGANNGRSMEIKASVGNVIELQLPMLSDIAIGNTVSLLAGFDGSREQARDKFGAMENFNGEPDLPGLKAVLVYPE